MKDHILKTISKHDKVYFSASSPDHINILDYIRLKSPREFEKIIVFLHASPSILKPIFIDRIKIIGNFSQDPYSFYVDHEFIDGKIDAYSRINTPVSISNGAVHNAINVEIPKYEGNLPNKIFYFKTSLEKKYYDEITALKEASSIKDSKIKTLKTSKKAITKEEKFRGIFIKSATFFAFLISTSILVFIYIKALKTGSEWQFYINNRRKFAFAKMIKMSILAMLVCVIFLDQDVGVIITSGILTIIFGLVVTELQSRRS